MTYKSVLSPDEVIYSTIPDFEVEYASINEPETLAPERQNLLISLSKRKFDGTLVTEIKGFIGKRIDLRKIEFELQAVCHTCSISKKYDIILMRDVRGRAYVYLRNEGFGVQLEQS